MGLRRVGMRAPSLAAGGFEVMAVTSYDVVFVEYVSSCENIGYSRGRNYDTHTEHLEVLFWLLLAMSVADGRRIEFFFLYNGFCLSF